MSRTIMICDDVRGFDPQKREDEGHKFVDFTLFDKPIVRDSTRVQACTLPACSGKLIIYPVVICQRRQH
jgi:hypothetical protein